MKVAIIEGSDFDDYNFLCESLEPYKSKIKLIIINDNNTLGKKYSLDNKIKHKVIYNENIINDSDCVVAFWNGISEGTNNLLNLCETYEKPYKVFYFKDKDIEYGY